MKVVIGLGATGLSCVDYLRRQAIDVIAMDSAKQPPALEVLQQQHPEVPCVFGRLDLDTLLQADEIVISPGVPLNLPEIKRAHDKGIPITGDIELFAREVKVPIYAVTGSNGKTTVTTLLGEIAKAANKDVKVAGNIGTPVLDCLKKPSQSGYVLELSSFQLETTESLQAKAAVVLNVSEDHMDRYSSFEDYRQAKLKIYKNSEYSIVNLDDPQSVSGYTFADKVITFSATQSEADYSVIVEGSQVYLAHQGKKLLDTAELPLRGLHHYQNALCALAFAKVMGVAQDSALEVLRQFKGLAHRCQLVRVIDGVYWYNDSKGTNVGATLSALRSVSEKLPGKKVILLAGGLAKEADFTPLHPAVMEKVKSVVLFGKDANKIAAALSEAAPIAFSSSLSEAVATASSQAQQGDCVLLSPACASFDMFSSYVDRGNQFIQLVEAL